MQPKRLQNIKTQRQKNRDRHKGIKRYIERLDRDRETEKDKWRERYRKTEPEVQRRR